MLLNHLMTLQPSAILQVTLSSAVKSTLLRVLSGIYKADKGEAIIDGINVYENTYMKNKLVFVADELFFLAGANMKSMAKFYSSIYDNFDMDIFTELTKTFGLDPSKSISNFSKGMKRQAAIILALSTRAKYMFFDETFDGLDPVMRNSNALKLTLIKIIQTCALISLDRSMQRKQSLLQFIIITNV